MNGDTEMLEAEAQPSGQAESLNVASNTNASNGNEDQEVTKADLQVAMSHEDPRPTFEVTDDPKIKKTNYRWTRDLKGHTDSVSAVRFSPDGSRLASVSADKTLKLWSSSGELIHEFTGHEKGINDVCWHPDQRYIATASDDTTVKIWDVETGQLALTCSGHTNFAFCCRYSPQGNQLVSGSFDETLRVWDARSGKIIKEIPAHSDPVTSVDFNKDGTMIASSSFDGLCRVWNTADGQCLQTILDDNNPPVTFAKFAPNGRYILTGTMDDHIRLWSCTDKSEKNTTLKRYTGHLNRHHCLSAEFEVTDPKVKRIIAGSECGGIFIYDLNKRAIVQHIAPASPEAPHGHSSVVCGISCHPKERIFASCALKDDCTIKIWKDETVEN